MFERYKRVYNDNLHVEINIWSNLDMKATHVMFKKKGRTKCGDENDKGNTAANSHKVGAKRTNINSVILQITI